MATILSRWNKRLESQLVQSLLAFAVRLATGLASFVLFAVVARVSGPNEFGTFSIFFSAAMLIGLVGSFGQQVFLVKEIPRARAAGDPATELGAYYFSGLTTVVGAAAGALMLAVCSRFISVDVGMIAVGAGALLCSLFAVSQTTMGVLRVQERTLLAMGTRDLLWRILSLVGIVILWAWLGRQGRTVSGASAILVLAVALLPVVLLHVWLITCKLYPEVRRQRAQWKLREWIGTSAGFALIAVISSADLYVYTVVLGFLLPASATGAFFASLKTVELLNLFLMAVTLIIGPRLSFLISQGRTAALQQQCNSAIVMQGLPAVVAGAVLFAGAPWFLSFFDPSYVASANLLRLLIVGMLINALTGATTLLLQLSGLHWRQVYYQGGSLLLSVGMLPVLVPMMGVTGAAVAFIMAKCLWNVLAIHAIRGRLGIDPSLLGLFSPIGGGLASVIADLRNQMRPSSLSVDAG